MTRKLIPIAAVGSTLLAGIASADDWCVCPPPRVIYCPPPMIYYAPPVHAPNGCPPGVPMNLPKPGELPKPMSNTPAPKGREERSKEVGPAESRDVPRNAPEAAPAPRKGSELATPTPAPPPDKQPDVPAPPSIVVEPAVPANAPQPMPEKKAETT